MPTVDQLLGPEPQQAQRTVDDILGPAPQTAASSPGLDHYFANSPTAHILSAFGQGAKQGWGSEPLGPSNETEDFLRKSGLWNDYKDGQTSLIKSFNEAVMRPAGAGLEAAARAGSALFSGAQAAVAQFGKEAGHEEAGRTIAAMPEAFYGTHHPIGIPEIAAARDLGVIGEGEAGWKGTTEGLSQDEARAAQAEALKRLTPTQESPASAKVAIESAPPVAEINPAAETAVPAPTVHDVARNIRPELFRQYDGLAQRQETFRRWLTELSDTRDQNATAEIDRQISDLKTRINTATGRRAANWQDQLSQLQTQREQALMDANHDTPDMVRVRQDLMKTDYAMRDLAPEISAAYRQAQELMPEAAEGTAEAAPPGAEAPAAPQPTQAPGEAQPIEAQPEEQPARPIPIGVEQPAELRAPGGEMPSELRGPALNIQDDVARKLMGAGRPEEEANAAAAIVAAHYEARAARMGRSADDLYQAEPANIEAAQKGRKGETGRSIVKDGQTTIRLLKNADASTFIHETGHQWLEELMQDASDNRAVQGVKNDAQTVRQWLGAEEGAAITRGQHEKFARGFERYMMEGVAPSQKLASVFAQFKDWLTKIYQTVARLRAPINDDIRQVFDRLISTPSERAIIAPERHIESGLGERHDQLAERTPVEQAEAIGDQVRAEADEFANLTVPEVADELGSGKRSEIVGSPTTGGEAYRNRLARQSDASPAGSRAPTGVVGPGGSEIAPEGSAASVATIEPPKTEPPTQPNQRFGLSETSLIDKAGNIRLDTLATPEDVNQVIREAAERNNSFVNARRGVISDAQGARPGRRFGHGCRGTQQAKAGTGVQRRANHRRAEASNPIGNSTARYRSKSSERI